MARGDIVKAEAQRAKLEAEMEQLLSHQQGSIEELSSLERDLRDTFEQRYDLQSYAVFERYADELAETFTEKL